MFLVIYYNINICVMESKHLKMSNIMNLRLFMHFKKA